LHPATGAPLDKSRIRKRFISAVKEAGITRHLTVHDLRHTFGTRMAAAGVPLRTIQEWMGHADFKTTQIYAEYAPSRDEAALVNRAFGTAFTLDKAALMPLEP
jgi:integrase